eukprot:1768473-Amphidinium_carterae.1
MVGDKLNTSIVTEMITIALPRFKKGKTLEWQNPGYFGSTFGDSGVYRFRGSSFLDKYANETSFLEM